MTRSTGRPPHAGHPELVMHRSHVFLPTFAVNPEKPLLPLRKTLSIGIPCLPNLRVANVQDPFPCLSFTGVFSFFRSSHFQAARTQVQRQKSTLHRILRCQQSDLTLCCPNWQLLEGNRAAPTFSQLRSPKPNHTLPSSENVKISRQAGEGTGDEDRSKEVSSFT